LFYIVPSYLTQINLYYLSLLDSRLSLLSFLTGLKLIYLIASYLTQVDLFGIFLLDSIWSIWSLSPWVKLILPVSCYLTKNKISLLYCLTQATISIYLTQVDLFDLFLLGLSWSFLSLPTWLKLIFLYCLI